MAAGARRRPARRRDSGGHERGAVPARRQLPGEASDAATLTAAPTISQPGVSAFGYTVASVPASLAARTRATLAPALPDGQPAPSMTQASPASQPPTSGGTLAPQPTAEYQTPTGQNQKAWSEAILTALGDPLTSANIVSIGYWMQNEAGSPPSGIVGANNPINVSEPGYGGTQIQSEGQGYYLMSYPTVAGRRRGGRRLPEQRELPAASSATSSRAPGSATRRSPENSRSTAATGTAPSPTPGVPPRARRKASGPRTSPRPPRRSARTNRPIAVTLSSAGARGRFCAPRRPG